MSTEGRERVRAAKLGSRNPNYGRTGELSLLWRGGRTYSDGYVMVRIEPHVPFHHMADKAHRIKEHRLFVAQQQGRCLLPWEIVHHRNGVRDDNRLENLELITDRKYHTIDNLTQAYIARLQNKVAKLEGLIVELRSNRNAQQTLE